MKQTNHSPEQIIRDIDTVLLAETQLLETLKEAVKYNALPEADAEQVLWDFRNQHGLDIPPNEYL